MSKALLAVQSKIQRYFDDSEARIFKLSDLGQILKHNRAYWHLSQNLSRSRFVDYLVADLQMQEQQLVSDTYGEVTRYTWGEVSRYALGLSLWSGAYLSHGSAAEFLGLSDEVLHTVYLNREQSAKPKAGGGQLSQSGIDRAFASQQRRSKYVFRLDQWQFVRLSGKQTNRLQVVKATGLEGESLDVTGPERTLIDVAVRPGYAGGVYKVLEIYEAARERISIGILLATLKQLDYSYPYHQVIGFYLERAGYSDSAVDRFRRLERPVDFYLAHGLKETAYSDEWRLFHPKGM